jgi:hypothetical protein
MIRQMVKMISRDFRKLHHVSITTSLPPILQIPGPKKSLDGSLGLYLVVVSVVCSDFTCVDCWVGGMVVSN